MPVPVAGDLRNSRVYIGDSLYEFGPARARGRIDVHENVRRRPQRRRAVSERQALRQYLRDGSACGATLRHQQRLPCRQYMHDRRDVREWFLPRSMRTVYAVDGEEQCFN